MKVFVVMYQYQSRKCSEAHIIGVFKTLENAIKTRDELFKKELESDGGSDDGWIVETNKDFGQKTDWIQYHNNSDYNIYQIDVFDLQE